jgi:hypothetical protein
VLGNVFVILSQKFQIYQRTLQSFSENADIILATCVLHNYLREQGVGLSDMGRCSNDRSNLKKHQTKHKVATKVLLKYEANLNNSLIVRLDLCHGRMKECNVRLICNIQLSWVLTCKRVLKSV